MKGQATYISVNTRNCKQKSPAKKINKMNYLTTHLDLSFVYESPCVKILKIE